MAEIRNVSKLKKIRILFKIQNLPAGRQVKNS